MRRRSILAVTIVLCLLCSLGLDAQQSDSSVSNNTNLPASSQPAAGTFPRLIKFTGEINPQITQIAQNKESPSGKNLLPTVLGVTFSLYELQEGGSPLWSESQKVQVDAQGHYTVLLGATQPEGLPLDLFTTGKALWLGVQPQLSGAGGTAARAPGGRALCPESVRLGHLGRQARLRLCLGGIADAGGPAGGAALLPPPPPSLAARRVQRRAVTHRRSRRLPAPPSPATAQPPPTPWPNSPAPAMWRIP